MSAVIHGGELSTPPDASGWLDHFGDVPKDESTQAVFTIFDDVVTTDVSLSVYSNPLLHGLLGAYDQIAIELTASAMASESASPPYIGARLEHSGDGRAWVVKAADPEIAYSTISTSAPEVAPLGFDDGTIPSLAFIRLRIDIGCDAPTQLYVTAKVTVNNTRERAFTASVRRTAETSDCDWVVEAGDRLLHVESVGFSKPGEPPSSVSAYSPMNSFMSVAAVHHVDYHQYFDFDPWISPPYDGFATLKTGFMICGWSDLVTLYDVSHGLHVIFWGSKPPDWG